MIWTSTVRFTQPNLLIKDGTDTACDIIQALTCKSMTKILRDEGNSFKISFHVFYSKTFHNFMIWHLEVRIFSIFWENLN